MSAGYCSVCRANVRGSYAIHAGTRRHRTNLVRAETRRGNKAVPRAAAIRRQNAGRTLRTNVDTYLAAITTRIRRHKRSRPNDGAAKVVTVTRYYRRKPAPTTYVARKLHEVAGAWYVVRYRDGVATSMRRATRAERAGAREGETL